MSFITKLRKINIEICIKITDRSNINTIIKMVFKKHINYNIISLCVLNFGSKSFRRGNFVTRQNDSIIRHETIGQFGAFRFYNSIL